MQILKDDKDYVLALLMKGISKSALVRCQNNYDKENNGRDK